MSSVLDSLRAQRKQTFTLLRAVVEPAAAANRELTPGEHADYTRLNDQLSALDVRIGELVGQDQRATDADATLQRLGPTGPGSLSAHNKELDQQVRSAILEKNPAPIHIAPPQYQTHYQPGIERRDLLTTTATQALPRSVYDQVVAHLVESTAVMAAGATVINTPGGEDLQVPKSTAFSASLITAEGTAITESDPTLAVVTLKGYKYATFFQVSYELATDTTTDLLGFLARQAALSLALAFGPHLITGTGTGQPRGIATDAAAGVTGPTGTATTFGAQGTAGQGTDLLNDLYSSLAEPYTRSPAAGWLLRTATLGAIRKLKATTGELVGNQFAGPPSAPGAQATMLGAPAFVDPGVAAMGASAESVLFGAFDRYFIRIAGGLRWERSTDFAFASDLVSFRCLTRLDAALIDLNAVKSFTHSAT